MNPRAILLALETLDWGPPPPINPHGPGILREADGWLVELGLADLPGRLDTHRRIAVPLLASLAYPTASREVLRLAHDWMAWIFEFDDQFDDGEDGHSSERARHAREQLGAVLEGSAGNVPRRTLQWGLNDIWERLRALAPPALCERFAGHVADYLASCEWETRNRRAGDCPDVDEYLAERQHTGAAHSCFDLLVPAMGLPYSRVDWTSARRGRLEYLCSEIITLTNDLVSFPKERARGDVHNLVLILMRRHGLSEQAAVLQSVEWLRGRIQDFEREARELARTAPQGLDEGTWHYVHGLRLFYPGCYVWSSRCRRFLVEDAVHEAARP